MAAHSAGNFFFQAAERDAAHFHLGGNARHAEIDCAMTDVEKERATSAIFWTGRRSNHAVMTF